MDETSKEVSKVTEDMELGTICSWEGTLKLLHQKISNKDTYALAFLHVFICSKFKLEREREK